MNSVGACGLIEDPALPRGARVDFGVEVAQGNRVVEIAASALGPPRNDTLVGDEKLGEKRSLKVVGVRL